MQAIESTHGRTLVLGVGGAGCNALKRISSAVSKTNHQLVALNTDAIALSRISDVEVLQLGGSGEPAGTPKAGREAGNNSAEALMSLLAGAARIHLFAGMGGGTGTGAAEVVALLAGKLGIPVDAYVTMPFEWEGRTRGINAIEGLGRLEASGASIHIAPNNLLSQQLPADASMEAVMDASLDALITKSGLNAPSH